jgi:uncharacterized protein involved in exopolysaccharide biosynthesis
MSSVNSETVSGKITGSDVVKEEMPEGINVLDLLIVLAGHKKWILQTTSAVTVLVAVCAFMLPNRYTATARILPPQQNQSLSAGLAGQLAGMGAMGAIAGSNLGLKNPNDMYVGMLKSQTVEHALVQRFELMRVYRDKRVSEAAEDLEKASAISSSKEGFINISVEDKDRKRAAALANGYVDELRSLMKRVAVTESGQRRVFFEQQVQEARENLAKAEEALKTTQQKTGVIQLDGQAKAIIEAVVELKAKVAVKEAQLQAMKAYAAPENPNLALANQELAGMRAQLAKMETQRDAAGGDVAIPTGNVPQAGLEYARRLRDVKYYESVFELLAKQYEVAKLDEARQGAVVQVIDPAVEPDQKSSPKRLMFIVITGFVGLLGSCIWIILVEALARLRELQPEEAKRMDELKKLLFACS